MTPPAEHEMGITHLRDCLGWAYQSVANTDEPIVIHRYRRADVALVPLWEWRLLKRIDAALRDGQIPWSDALADILESAGN